MWRHDDMRKAQLDAQKLLGPVPETLEENVALIAREGPGRRTLSSCPLMHGTGFITAIGTLMSGGAIVTLEAWSFDAEELWDTVERHKVEGIAIVGDRSEEHTSELQSLMRISYAVFCLKKKRKKYDKKTAMTQRDNRTI